MSGGPPSHSSGRTSALLPILVQKELRALVPTFAATTAVVLLCRLGLENELMTLGLGVYVLGAAALGALSIGHEYTHDTLGQLLAQPGRRARLLMVKLLVLGALLVVLGATATVTAWPWIERSFVGVGHGDQADALRWPIVLIPALLAAFVAPLLTMLSRSAIAGTVFTVGIYAGLWLIAPGMASPSLPEERFDVGFYADTMLWIAVAVSVMSAGAAAMIFSRLEFTGSHGAMAWTASRRGDAGDAQAASSRRHPAVALIRKELRLQTVSFVVAGLYGMVWAFVPLFARESPERAYVFETVTVLFQVVLAVLIGAVASAEERGLGTLQWQTLQPYAQWKQWTIKVGTALVLSVLLVIVLPAALQAIAPRGGDTFVLGLQLPNMSSQVIVRPQIWTFAAGVLALTAGALFVSSLTRSSLHALLVTPVLIPLILAATGIPHKAGGDIVWRALDLNRLLYGAAGWRVTRWEDSDFLWLDWSYFLAVTTAVLGFLFLLLRFGLNNHRSAEAPRRLIARQVLAMMVYCIVAAAVVGSSYALEVWYLATH